jgi:hypothetical protein
MSGSLSVLHDSNIELYKNITNAKEVLKKAIHDHAALLNISEEESHKEERKEDMRVDTARERINTEEVAIL